MTRKGANKADSSQHDVSEKWCHQTSCTQTLTEKNGKSRWVQVSCPKAGRKGRWWFAILKWTHTAGKEGPGGGLNLVNKVSKFQEETEKENWKLNPMISRFFRESLRGGKVGGTMLGHREPKKSPTAEGTGQRETGTYPGSACLKNFGALLNLSQRTEKAKGRDTYLGTICSG